MATLPPAEVLYQWARGRRPPLTRSYFGDLARQWQSMARRHLRDGKRAPKNYLGLHWQGVPASQRQRAAYQMLKKG